MKIKEGDIVAAVNGLVLTEHDKKIFKVVKIHHDFANIYDECSIGRCNSCSNVGHISVENSFGTQYFACHKQVRPANDREKFLYYMHGSNVFREEDDEAIQGG